MSAQSQFQKKILNLDSLYSGAIKIESWIDKHREKKPTILCNLSYKLNRKSKKSELID